MIIEGEGQPDSAGGPLGSVEDAESSSGAIGSAGGSGGGKRMVRSAVVNKNAVKVCAVVMPFSPALIRILTGEDI